MTLLEQPRWRRQQEGGHIFAYLTMKNNTFARFARAFVIFGHFADVLVLSSTWNDQSNCFKKKVLEDDWLLTAFIYGLIGFFRSKLSNLNDLSDYKTFVIGQAKSDTYAANKHFLPLANTP